MQGPMIGSGISNGSVGGKDVMNLSQMNKKSVQPHQPRHRDDGSSRRSHKLNKPVSQGQPTQHNAQATGKEPV